MRGRGWRKQCEKKRANEKRETEARRVCFGRLNRQTRKQIDRETDKYEAYRPTDRRWHIIYTCIYIYIIYIYYI